jgi:arsenate reductase-like glutaredoxin family protein
MGFIQQTLCIVGSYRSLEAMENQHTRCARFSSHTVQLEKVSIRSIDALERGRCRGLSAEQLAPECLKMAARNPPGWRINYLTSHSSWNQYVRTSLPSRSEGEHLEVQIFGIKKSADTRKALRFFAERRIRTHFVDLMERAASPGELKRFAQKFGINALIDKQSKRFDELGLRYAQLSDERWLEKLSDEPMLLRMPLVRNANQLGIGADEALWKTWINK